MRPLTWALKEVDPVGLHRQSGTGNIGIVKITLKLYHISKNSLQKNVWQEDGPLANDALCLSTMVNPALMSCLNAL